MPVQVCFTVQTPRRHVTSVNNVRFVGQVLIKREITMWILVFIYFYETMPYVEKVTVADTMENCFRARDALSVDVGKGNGYFLEGQQALCIKME